MEHLETLKDYLKLIKAKNEPICITVCNRKGGVGKTSASLSIANTLAVAGFQCLVIDADGQQSASNNVGINNAYENNPVLQQKNLSTESRRLRAELAEQTEYEVDDLFGLPKSYETAPSKYAGLHDLIKTVIKGKPLTSSVIETAVVKPTMKIPELTEEQRARCIEEGLTVAELIAQEGEKKIKYADKYVYGFDLLPASEELNDDEYELNSSYGNKRTEIFGNIVKAIKKHCSYDVIIIDSAPAMGIFTVNAINACDACLLIGVPDKQSVNSLGKIKKNIRENKILKKHSGYLLGFVNNMTSESDVLKPIMENWVKNDLKIFDFKTLIPKRNNASKATATNTIFTQVDKDAREAYKALCLEIFHRYYDMKEWDDKCEERVEQIKTEILANAELKKSLDRKAIAFVAERIKDDYGIDIKEFYSKNASEVNEAFNERKETEYRRYIFELIENGKIRWEKQIIKEK